MSIGPAGTTNGKANEIHTAFTTYQDELTWLSGISFVGPAFEHRDTVTGGLKNDCGDFVTGGGIAHYRTLRHRYRRWTPLSDSCQQHTAPLNTDRCSQERNSMSREIVVLLASIPFGRSACELSPFHIDAG